MCRQLRRGLPDHDFNKLDIRDRKSPPGICAPRASARARKIFPEKIFFKKKFFVKIFFLCQKNFSSQKKFFQKIFFSTLHRQLFLSRMVYLLKGGFQVLEILGAHSPGGPEITTLINKTFGTGKVPSFFWKICRPRNFRSALVGELQHKKYFLCHVE